jgi:UDPglucose 6-dehydrogenase
MTMRITVLGTGYEGLTISVGLAMLGHTVTAVEVNRSRARRFQRGIYSGPDEELAENLKIVLRAGQLKFTSEPENSLTEAESVVIAGIPGFEKEAVPERAAILRTAECLSGAIASFSTVIVTAKVPTGSCRILQDWLDDALYTGAAKVVACPVFFSETGGVKDFLNPDRIVLGYENESARRDVDEVFAALLTEDPPVCHVSWEAAEMMRDPVGAIGGTSTAGNPKTKTPSAKAYSKVAQHR